MTTKSFARIESGLVAEIFATHVDPITLFHPALTWVDVTDLPKVSIGWAHDDGGFSPPTTVAVPAAPSLAELQAQLHALQAKIGSLTSGS